MFRAADNAVLQSFMANLLALSKVLSKQSNDKGFLVLQRVCFKYVQLLSKQLPNLFCNSALSLIDCILGYIRYTTDFQAELFGFNFRGIRYVKLFVNCLMHHCSGESNTVEAINRSKRIDLWFDDFTSLVKPVVSTTTSAATSTQASPQTVSFSPIYNMATFN
jgi:hypothetical protein